jgi:hypothetical protein
MTFTRRSSPRTSAWLAYLTAGAVAVVVHATMETGTLPQSLLYGIIGASAVAAALVGIRLHRPDQAAPWLAMAFGEALFVAGDLTKAQGKGRSHRFSADDLLDNQAVTRGMPEREAAGRRRIAFRKPSMGRPAFGQEPG